jgi:hypothetical protein
VKPAPDPLGHATTQSVPRRAFPFGSFREKNDMVDHIEPGPSPRPRSPLRGSRNRCHARVRLAELPLLVIFGKGTTWLIILNLEPAPDPLGHATTQSVPRRASPFGSFREKNDMVDHIEPGAGPRPRSPLRGCQNRCNARVCLAELPLLVLFGKRTTSLIKLKGFLVGTDILRSTTRLLRRLHVQ